MMEILNLSFFQHALIGSFLVSIACGVIGTYVVVNRMVFMAGGIAHGAYGGIGFALFFGLAPLLGATIFALILALVIATITLQNQQRTDAVIGVIWAFGMAIGIIFVDLTPGYNVDLMSYLFGSILSISKLDIWVISSIDLLILSITSLFYRQLQAMSFDSEFAALRGVRVNFLYYVLLLLTALCVVASIQAVGLILVIALLTIPPYLAELFTKHLHSAMIVSMMLAIFFCISGLFVSYFLNISAGATIIFVASLSFFIIVGAKKLKE